MVTLTMRPKSTQFNPSSFTAAPLRLVMQTPVLAHSDKALATILDVGRIVDYLSSIKRVNVSTGSNGIPDERVCTVSGMGDLTENIVWFDEDHGYAYAAQPSRGLPMVNHLAVATVNPRGDQSLITWKQYFDWKGFVKPVMMKLMFPSMMKSVGKGLQTDLGAAGPIEVKWVK